MFFCAISGSPPLHPVISLKSGHVYEKSLIESYIDQNGTDPITGEALGRGDLVEVKAKPQTLPPRPPHQSSIPTLLTSLQSEYDAIMLESLEVKRAYQSGRQELANALYREDAAVRALGRVIRERDEARSALATIKATIGDPSISAMSSAAGGGEASASAGAGAGAGAQDVEMAGPEEGEVKTLGEEVEEVVVRTNEALSTTRKKRKPPVGYTNTATLKTFTQTTTVPSLHNTKPPGITSLDVSADGKVAITGGADGHIHLYDFESEKVVGSCKGHKKAVGQVEVIRLPGEDGNGRIVSSAGDKTVKLWTANKDDGKWKLDGELAKGNKADVAGFAIHPSKRYVGIASADSVWTLRDLESQEIVSTYKGLENSFEGSFAYSSFTVHPDGMLFGGGVEDGNIRIWDVRDASTLAATLKSHESPVTSLSFSENGYYLASASKSDSAVKIFDLRKIKLLSTITSSAPNDKINEVRFDPSAQFLSVVGVEARVYANKSWEEVLKFDDNAGELMGARFAGERGEKVVLAGLDRTLRVLSAPVAAE